MFLARRFSLAPRNDKYPYGVRIASDKTRKTTTTDRDRRGGPDRGASPAAALVCHLRESSETPGRNARFIVACRTRKNVSFLTYLVCNIFHGRAGRDRAGLTQRNEYIKVDNVPCDSIKHDVST